MSSQSSQVTLALAPSRRSCARIAACAHHADRVRDFECPPARCGGDSGIIAGALSEPGALHFRTFRSRNPIRTRCWRRRPRRPPRRRETSGHARCAVPASGESEGEDLQRYAGDIGSIWCATRPRWTIESICKGCASRWRAPAQPYRATRPSFWRSRAGYFLRHAGAARRRRARRRCRLRTRRRLRPRTVAAARRHRARIVQEPGSLTRSRCRPCRDWIVELLRVAGGR